MRMCKLIAVVCVWGSVYVVGCGGREETAEEKTAREMQNFVRRLEPFAAQVKKLKEAIDAGTSVSEILATCTYDSLAASAQLIWPPEGRYTKGGSLELTAKQCARRPPHPSQQAEDFDNGVVRGVLNEYGDAKFEYAKWISRSPVERRFRLRGMLHLAQTPSQADMEKWELFHYLSMPRSTATRFIEKYEALRQEVGLERL